MFFFFLSLFRFLIQDMYYMSSLAKHSRLSNTKPYEAPSAELLMLKSPLDLLAKMSGAALFEDLEDAGEY